MARKNAAPANREAPAVKALESDDPILHLVDGQPLRHPVPERDLTAADLVRLHRIRSLRQSGGRPVQPATDEDITALTDELVESGAFNRKPGPAPQPAASDKE